MDQLNRELIDAKLRLTQIETDKDALEVEYQFLQDKLHLYFDSAEHDTTVTEKFIISDFWSKAYKEYKDGGYITNDEYITSVRFSYEQQMLDRIIEEKSINRGTAIDIGCGNGRYTNALSKYFDNTIGIDLSKARVEDNIRENSNDSINYLHADFMAMDSDKLGTFDFVFVTDLFTYTNEAEIEAALRCLLKLLNKNGVLFIRESTMMIGHEDYKSRKYVAYYRNVDFYRNGHFKQYFEEDYRNYAYNLYHLYKYFNVHKEKRDEIRNNPMLLDYVVKNYVEKSLRTCHFFLYKNNV